MQALRAASVRHFHFASLMSAGATAYAILLAIYAHNFCWLSHFGCI